MKLAAEIGLRQVNLEGRVRNFLDKQVCDPLLHTPMKPNRLSARCDP